MSSKALNAYKFKSSDMIQMLYAKMDEIEAAYKKSNKLLEQAETLSKKAIPIDLESFENLVKEQKAEQLELNKKNIEEIKAISSDLKTSFKSSKVNVPNWVYIVLIVCVLAYTSIFYVYYKDMKNYKIMEKRVELYANALEECKSKS